jgi:hypothetical protein
MAVTPQNKTHNNMDPDTLSNDFTSVINCFLGCAKANRLSRNLNFMLLAYLDRHKRGFPLFHDALMYDLEHLFYLLDEASKEQRKRKRAMKAARLQPSATEGSP